MVKKTINALKQRLWENNDVIEVYKGNGEVNFTTCTFYEGLVEEIIHQFEQKHRCVMPKDYREFLRETNGCRLFESNLVENSVVLYRLEDMESQCSEDYITIGVVNQNEILLRREEASEHSVIIKSKYEPVEQAVNLHMTFEQWFDRLIMSQGNLFWTWSVQPVLVRIKRFQ
ncbi:SMI1/KNR4 family protein [Priestia flexa]|uniref:SMI1/KNR4 family protein n=1 Tax=Priestia flexa TaxID=86664 RepID=UPI00240D43A9|nr:SMI1/KNR4 family protein [Priestia flexa]WEZ07197.1 SMI1/KNR4 family protein [Priestia flexa]